MTAPPPPLPFDDFQCTLCGKRIVLHNDAWRLQATDHENFARLRRCSERVGVAAMFSFGLLGRRCGKIYAPLPEDKEEGPVAVPWGKE